MSMRKQPSTEQRLKVLFITPWYPTAENPVDGIFVREHAKAVQLYDDVAVLHFAGHMSTLAKRFVVKEETDPSLTEGVRTYRFQYRTAARRWLAHPTRFWSYWRAFRHLWKHEFQPDIIHANIHVTSLPAILLGWLYRIPVVVMEHHSVFPRRSLPPRRVWEARVAFKRACRVLPVCKALRQAIEDYNIQARFQIVPNVVDMKLFGPPPITTQAGTHNCRFLCVANLPANDVKGISYLLDAVAQLRNVDEGWQLQIAGDGTARPVYEEQVRRLQLQDKVMFLGRKSKTEIAHLMQQADVFVLPSVWENLPCVIVEAMASGLPILATRVGGVPEMVDETSGILVPIKSVDALVAALTQMLQQHKAYDRQRIAANARNRYSQEVVGQMLDVIYQECVSESVS